MNYELAKELKDAGFPQNDEDGGFRIKSEGEQFCWCGTCQVEFYTESDLKESVCSPTLEELIEACGEGFAGLNYDNDFKVWHTQRYMMGGYVAENVDTYHTPTEAVARLWLALNKKK